MSKDEYHAEYDSISKTMLSTFLDRRRVYYETYITKAAPPRASSKAMDLGTAVHAALLEPLKFAEMVVTIPAELLAKVDGEVSENGAESTKAAKAFRAEHEAVGKVVLKPNQFADAGNMVASVLRSPVGKWLENAAIIETPRYWTDDVSGLRCRSLPDWFLPEKGIMLDIKSTKLVKPAAFAKQADDLRYWLQASHYLDSIGGEGRFLFVAVESEWPYETVVYEYPRSDGGDSIDLEFADAVRVRALQDIAECHASGNWNDSWSGVVNKIERRYSKGKV